MGLGLAEISNVNFYPLTVISSSQFRKKDSKQVVSYWILAKTYLLLEYIHIL